MELSKRTKKLAGMNNTLATLAFALVLCPSVSNARSSANMAVKPPVSEVQVLVDGPWAYADDPRDATRVVLIAPSPSSINHFIPAIGHKGGALELSLDSRVEIDKPAPSPCPGCSSDVPYRPKVDRQGLIDLLNSKKDRYLISLPKPDFYEEGISQESKVGTVWWGDCYPSCKGSSTQAPFTTQVILHYATDGSNGFSVNGKSLHFEDHNRVEIFMNPKGKMEDCDSGGRLAFRGLVRLFSLKLYVDYGDANNHYPSDDDPEDCLGSDPQNPSNAMAASLEVALDRLGDYVVQPMPADAAQARADWNQVNHARNLVPDNQRKQFGADMVNLDTFLKKVSNDKKIKIDSSVTVAALQSLRAVHGFIPFHDGSGACRNPLLGLTF